MAVPPSDLRPINVPSLGSSLDTGFLGIERSLTGRLWRQRPAPEGLYRPLQQRFDLSLPLAQALVGRGFTADTAAAYLYPTLKDLFPDPSSFLDMDKAVDAVLSALDAGQKITIFADYDVDGATSGALLVRWFRHMGHEVPIYVPDRLTEGYGPSRAAFSKIKDQGTDLVITVDCGAAAYDAIDFATTIGLSVVVIDHHLMREDPPRCLAVVNPNRPGCNSGQGNLAAAGVVFVLLAALNREARARGLFASQAEPSLLNWLDIAALGAICDVTPLFGFNRALAQKGLSVMARWANPGLKALNQVAGGKGSAGTYEAGFLLGPRINAGGRIGRADLGANLLSTDDPILAEQLANELDRLNVERREVEAAVTLEAQHQLDQKLALMPDCPVLLAIGEGWHPGVIGICAGRLRERYRRPVIVIGLDPATQMAKGSGRSHPGVNLGQAVAKAFEQGLILAGGGHAMAAGLTCRHDQLDGLEAFLHTHLMEASHEARISEAVEIDCLVSPASATRALCDQFQIMAPFGPSNPEPLFALSDLKISFSSVMGQGHIRCELVDEDGAKIKAIAWRAAETDLGRRLLSREGRVHVCGRLRPDDYMNRRGVQLEIEDLADPRQSVTCG